MEGNGQGGTQAVFAGLLNDHPTAHSDLTDALRELVEAVQLQGKKGSLTMVLTVEPAAAADSLAVAIACDVKTTLPRPKPESRLFYIQRDGFVGRKDPRQTTIFDKTTGEVIEP